MNNRLTKTELEIMQYMWNINRECTASDIRNYFYMKNWSKQTVSTFLKKLVNSGFLNVRKTSISKYYYSAAITEDDYKIMPAKDIMYNDFSNSLCDFICALANPTLKPDQIQKLEDLISEFEMDN